MANDSAAAIETIFDAVAAAEADGPIAHRGSDALQGISGLKTVGLLQRLARNAAARSDLAYVEIGVFQGLTLLSVALAAPGISCFGIDNFSILDPEGENLAIVESRIRNLAPGNAFLINDDFEAALDAIDRHLDGRRIGVFFVDGAHDYRSQLMALLLGAPHLADGAAVVIDDANYAYVRRSTADFLRARPDFRLVFEGYSPAHPANLDAQTLARFEVGWLNGIHVLTRDPDGLLPVMMPPLTDDRDLYVNDWLVHRHGVAQLAPEALALAAAVCTGDAAAESTARTRIMERYAQIPEPPYPDRNTFSDGLTEGRFNERPRKTLS